MATTNVSTASEDGKQLAAHKLILNYFFFLLMLGELMNNGVAAGLGPNVNTL